MALFKLVLNGLIVVFSNVKGEYIYIYLFTIQSCLKGGLVHEICLKSPGPYPIVESFSRSSLSKSMLY